MRIGRYTLALSFVCIACASPAPVPEPKPDAKPFIKLAERRFGLLVHFGDGDYDAEYRKKLTMALRDRFSKTYGVPVITKTNPGPFRDLGYRTLHHFIARETDDLIVVDLLPEGDGAFSARGMVYVTKGPTLLHGISVPALRSKDGGQPKSDLAANLIAKRITSLWLNPGGQPRVDLLEAANKFADQGHCVEALDLYRRKFQTWRPTTLPDIQLSDQAKKREATCATKVAYDEAIAADARAVYEFHVVFKNVAPRLKAALQAAIAKTRLKKKFASKTNKPVFLTISPGQILLSMRFDVRRYRRATRGRPTFEKENAIVYLDPFLATMKVIADVKDRAHRLLSPVDRPTLNGFRTVLRLHRILDDYVDLEFADRDEAILLTSSAMVRVAPYSAVEITSVRPRMPGKPTLYLGKPEESDGKLTAHGLMFKFFKLPPYDK